MPRSQRVLIIVICLAWCLPLALCWVQHVPGLRVLVELPLWGVEAPPSIELSARAIRSGDFQANVGTAVTRTLFGRPSLVRTANSVAWLVQGTTEVPSIVVAPDGWLFERQYCRDWIGVQEPVDPTSMATGLADLDRLADDLAGRGIPLVVVLAPSKVATHPDRLPEAWRRPVDAERDYDRWAQVCADTLGDRWFDAAAFVRNLPPEHRFSSIGTHWSYLAAARVIERLAVHVNESMEGSLPLFQVIDIKPRDRGRMEENDLGELLNLWWVPPTKTFNFRWRPVERTGLKVVLVGDSFTWTLATLLVGTGAVSRLDLLYYNSTHYRVVQATNGKVDQDEFREVLLQADLVVVEWNESFFHRKYWKDFAHEQAARIGNRE